VEKINYFKYEEKTALHQLEQLGKTQTFKIGLDLSDFAVKMLLKSFENKYRGLSRKAVLDKLGAYLRNN